jgi:flagellar motility protein MotE (MotC chaperone)
VKIEEVEIPVYRAGTMQFVSTVPSHEAASLFTAGNVQEVSRMLEGKAFEAFVKLFDDNEDQARSWLESNVDETNRTIEAEGAITRSQPGASTRAADGISEADQDAESTEVPQSETPQVEPVERVVELDDEAISALVERVTGSDTFGDLSASIETIGQEIAALTEQLGVLKAKLDEDYETTGERIKALERTDEEKEREWMEDIPRRETVRVTHRPREMNDPNRPDSMADTAAATLANTPGR